MPAIILYHVRLVLQPEFDHLLLDMNGIIHRCTHSDDTLTESLSIAEIMARMRDYLDKFIAVVKPKKTIYFAVGAKSTPDYILYMYSISYLLV
jgi:5'-3' exonuclease